MQHIPVKAPLEETNEQVEREKHEQDGARSSSNLLGPDGGCEGAERDEEQSELEEELEAEPPNREAVPGTGQNEYSN